MKKVGIITIQKPPENYGASLQAYALWKYIDNLGFDCEIIDLLRPWHPQYKISSRDPLFKKSIKQKLIRLLFLKRSGYRMLNTIRCKKFENFNNLCRYSKCFKSVDELYNDIPLYDFYISGSDQIWNPNMDIVNEPYFLTFAPINAKKISYASSFAVQTLPIDISNQFKDWLKSYDNISVREEKGVELINDMGLEKNVEAVLDPTFLLKKENWIELFDENSIDTNKYIFVYLLHSNDMIFEYIKAKSLKLGLKVKIVVSDTSAHVPCCFESLMDIGPIEWIKYIQNAKYVITDSFHCTVFSLIFERTFQTIACNKTVSSRLQNLLSKVGAESNLVYVDDLTINHAIPNVDYHTINKKIEEERNKSIAYLTKSLNI